MCDDHTEQDRKASGRANLSRRGFTAMAAGTLVACAGGVTADGRTLDVVEATVDVPTPDGTADCYFAHPTKGKHAAVLVWPDVMGLRPAYRQMGKRLAESGYAVLVVNPYYRSARGDVIAPGESFGDAPVRERLTPFAQRLNPAAIVSDATAHVKFLDAHPAVDIARKVGVTGYCMGGPFTMRTAAAMPERIGAGASFHGGGLATQTPNSPHLLVPRMKAGFLFAIAEPDDAREPDAKNVLRETFRANNLAAEIEVYPAEHGWCPPDSDVYDHVQAEKAWSRMLSLFQATLA